MLTTADFLPTLADFAPHIGQELLVEADPKALKMRLESAAPSVDTGLGKQAPFSLILSTPWTTLLVEGAYPMRLGERRTIIHVIPTQTAPGPRRFYHAVFN